MALWKAVEREHARRLKGKRVPVNSTSGVECDVQVDLYSVESKERIHLPSLVEKAMIQAEGHCEPGKMALVVMHQKGTNYDKDIVFCRLKDFQERFV